ncbi:MAG: SOS response-associated peptidase [Planctomycetota bacterium]
MCGRFTLSTSSATLMAQFELASLPALAPRYNIAPTQLILCVRAAAPREAALLHWGLIPTWAEDPKIGNRMINARGETVAEKPAFRSAFRRRRCLIIADGYYEWQASGRQKQPYLFTRPDQLPFGIAGLWENWSAPDGTQVESCTLITTEANSFTRPVHDRMPVILAPADYSLWLDPGSPSPALLALIRPSPEDLLQMQAVSTFVNNPRHESPDCITPLPKA